MKNLSRTFLLCLALILLAVAMASAAPFVSPKGYSFTPASGWRLNHSRMGGTDVIAYTSPVEKFAPNLNIVVEPTTSGVTLEKGQKKLGVMYPRMFTGFKMISSKIGRLDAAQTLTIISVYRQGVWVLRMRQLIAIRGPQTYTFTCTTPEATHMHYDAAFTQMLQSIRWSK